jgi:hypothetical protein
LELFFGAFTSEWEQRRAALLHELALGGGRSTAEEELRRRMKALAELGAAGGGGGGGRAAPKTRHAASKSMHGTAAKASTPARPMHVRLAAVAQGSQPACQNGVLWQRGAGRGDAQLRFAAASFP